MLGVEGLLKVLGVIPPVAPLPQPRLLFFYFLFCPCEWFLSQHAQFHEFSEPQALWWVISNQSFDCHEFKKHLIVVVTKRTSFVSSTSKRIRSIRLGMIRMQDKAPSIPEPTEHSLDWRISFLIAEIKREIGMIRKHL